MGPVLEPRITALQQWTQVVTSMTRRQNRVQESTQASNLEVCFGGTDIPRRRQNHVPKSIKIDDFSHFRDRFGAKDIPIRRQNHVQKSTQATNSEVCLEAQTSQNRVRASSFSKADNQVLKNMSKLVLETSTFWHWLKKWMGR